MRVLSPIKNNPAWLLVLAAILFSGAARAEFPAGTYMLQIENDRLADTDRHYTHGTRLAWVSDKADDGPGWVKDILERLYPLATLRFGRAGLALGQNIYTPEDTGARHLVTNDRPYAGWLYAGLSAHAETTHSVGGLELETLDSVELDIGVVGPAALGAEVQNNFHDLIDVSRSKGWAHQLENEPGLMLVFDRRWRPDPVRVGGLEADILPGFGGSLGNVMTFGRVGGILRLGQDLAVDYGPPLIRPSLSGHGAVDPVAGFAWYLFAGAEGRAVLRNIFLDGNTVADSHHVDKKTLVAEFQLGAAIVVKGVRLAATHVFRTPEFDGQRRADRYTAVSVSARF